MSMINKACKVWYQSFGISPGPGMKTGTWQRAEQKWLATQQSCVQLLNMHCLRS